MENRRFFLKTFGSIVAISLADIRQVSARENGFALAGAAPVNVIIPKDMRPLPGLPPKIIEKS